MSESGYCVKEKDEKTIDRFACWTAPAADLQEERFCDLIELKEFVPRELDREINITRGFLFDDRADRKPGFGGNRGLFFFEWLIQHVECFFTVLGRRQ
jgi:hypothetical protein